MLSILGQMDWEDENYPRVLYTWQYNGCLIISPFRRNYMPDAQLDGIRQVLKIVPTQMYPDYSNVDRKLGWFRDMCGYMKIQLIEE